MGDFTLRDPVTGDGQHVDANQLAHTFSVTLPEKDFAAVKGWKFNVNTGDIAITNTTKVSLLYIKNNENYDLMCDSFIYNIGTSTGGSGDWLVDVVINPTAGDIITNANDCQVPGSDVESNQNTGSTNTLSGNFYKGAQGETALSGGRGESILTRASGATRAVISLGGLVVAKGGSIGFNFTPPGSNTSMNVQFAIACHLRHPDVVAT